MLRVVSLAEYTLGELVCVAWTAHWYDDLGGPVERGPSLAQGTQSVEALADRDQAGRAVYHAIHGQLDPVLKFYKFIDDGFDAPADLGASGYQQCCMRDTWVDPLQYSAGSP